MLKQNVPSSIIGLSYCHKSNNDNFLNYLEEISKKLKGYSLEPREIKFYEIPVPLDNENYKIVISSLQKIIIRDYWKTRNPLNHEFKLMGMDLKKIFFEKLSEGFKPINFLNSEWEHEKNHKALQTFLPLLYDKKINHITEEQKNNLIKLENFKI